MTRGHTEPDQLSTSAPYLSSLGQVVSSLGVLESLRCGQLLDPKCYFENLVNEGATKVEFAHEGCTGDFDFARRDFQ